LSKAISFGWKKIVPSFNYIFSAYFKTPLNRFTINTRLKCSTNISGYLL